MKLIKKALQKLSGLHFSQDYLCLSEESFDQPLHCYLVDRHEVVKDITSSHFFVGYSPLIFAFHAFHELRIRDVIDIAFFQEELTPGDNIRKKQRLAILQLKKVNIQRVGSLELIYFEGVYGKHIFISPIHQLISNWQNILFNKRPGNVFLNTSLYRQVQIAYALPRKISLVTVGQGNYNLFPTDLHGQISERNYVISLRHAGRACEQVLEGRKIALSDMQASAYQRVYSLGKNHMQPLKPPFAFPFSGAFSQLFNLPLPENLIAYKELELVDSFIRGIHRILLFEIRNSVTLNTNPHTLAHIHNAYATWRFNNQLPGNFLLR